MQYYKNYFNFNIVQNKECIIFKDINDIINKFNSYNLLSLFYIDDLNVLKLNEEIKQKYNFLYYIKTTNVQNFINDIKNFLKKYFVKFNDDIDIIYKFIYYFNIISLNTYYVFDKMIFNDIEYNTNELFIKNSIILYFISINDNININDKENVKKYICMLDKYYLFLYALFKYYSSSNKKYKENKLKKLYILFENNLINKSLNIINNFYKQNLNKMICIGCVINNLFIIYLKLFEEIQYYDELFKQCIYRTTSNNYDFKYFLIDAKCIYYNCTKHLKYIHNNDIIFKSINDIENKFTSYNLIDLFYINSLKTLTIKNELCDENNFSNYIKINNVQNFIKELKLFLRNYFIKFNDDIDVINKFVFYYNVMNLNMFYVFDYNIFADIKYTQKILYTENCIILFMVYLYFNAKHIIDLTYYNKIRNYIKLIKKYYYLFYSLFKYYNIRRKKYSIFKIQYFVIYLNTLNCKKSLNLISYIFYNNESKKIFYVGYLINKLFINAILPFYEISYYDIIVKSILRNIIYNKYNIDNYRTQILIDYNNIMHHFKIFRINKYLFSSSIIKEYINNNANRINYISFIIICNLIYSFIDKKLLNNVLDLIIDKCNIKNLNGIIEDNKDYINNNCYIINFYPYKLYFFLLQLNNEIINIVYPNKNYDYMLIDIFSNDFEIKFNFTNINCIYNLMHYNYTVISINDKKFYTTYMKRYHYNAKLSNIDNSMNNNDSLQNFYNYDYDYDYYKKSIYFNKNHIHQYIKNNIMTKNNKNNIKKCDIRNIVNLQNNSMLNKLYIVDKINITYEYLLNYMAFLNFKTSYYKTYK